MTLAHSFSRTGVFGLISTSTSGGTKQKGQNYLKVFFSFMGCLQVTLSDIPLAEEDTPMLFLSVHVYVPISFLVISLILREGYSVLTPSNLSSVNVKFCPSFCLWLGDIECKCFCCLQLAYQTTMLRVFGLAL